MDVMASRVTMLAAEIVAAYVAGQTVSAEAVPGLIRQVHQSLRNLPVAPPPFRPEPAQVRQLVAREPKGVFPDHLICLADVERDLIRTRTAERRSRAKARGQHMSRPLKLTPQQQAEARRRRAEGATLKELARSYNVAPATISRLKD